MSAAFLGVVFIRTPNFFCALFAGLPLIRVLVKWDGLAWYWSRCSFSSVLMLLMPSSDHFFWGWAGAYVEKRSVKAVLVWQRCGLSFLGIGVSGKRNCLNSQVGRISSLLPYEAEGEAKKYRPEKRL